MCLVCLCVCSVSVFRLSRHSVFWGYDYPSVFYKDLTTVFEANRFLCVFIDTAVQRWRLTVVSILYVTTVPVCLSCTMFETYCCVSVCCPYREGEQVSLNGLPSDQDSPRVSYRSPAYQKYTSFQTRRTGTGGKNGGWVGPWPPTPPAPHPRGGLYTPPPPSPPTSDSDN